MQFTPKTDKEINEANLWPAGEYSFQIAKAEDYFSQNSGKESIKLTINIANNEAKGRVLFDYLTPNFASKWKHCLHACGLIKEYDMGSVDAISFEGKEGILKLGIQKGNEQFPNDKNTILDYVVGAAASKLTPAQEAHTKAKGNAFVAEDLDDEIPY